MITSFFQPSNHFGIVIYKCNLSDFLFVVSFVFRIISLILHDIDSRFKNFLQINFKLSNFTHWVSRIKILSDPSFIGFLINFMFGRIITSSDSFDIPIDIQVLLNGHHIIEINYGE